MDEFSSYGVGESLNQRKRNNTTQSAEKIEKSRNISNAST